MKRTVSQGRAPEPLEVYAYTDELKSEMVDTTEELSSQGYGEDFMYQVRTVAPPLYETGDILDELQDSFAYVVVAGTGENGRRDKNFRVEHELGNTEEFQETAQNIDSVVQDLGYELDHWHLGSVSTSARSGSKVAEDLDGMQVQATAAVDAGLGSQRDEMGFQPIRLGWFQKAPMNQEMQFGYRAFPNREFQHDEKKEYGESGEELLEDVLGRITGMRDDEVNMHNLEEEEIEVLKQVEDEMQEEGLL